jgi:prepilin-type N-terminal cleavage/methylation domain-containing protein
MTTSKKGFGIIESMVSLSIAAVILLAFLTLVINTVKASRLYSTELKASLYLAEAIEAAKDLEISTDWSVIPDWDAVFAACSPECYPEISSNKWQFSSGSETLETEFTRIVTIEGVCRDSVTFPNNIVDCGEPIAVDDPDTKQVIAEVSWFNGYGNRTLNLETYVYK